MLTDNKCSARKDSMIVNIAIEVLRGPQHAVKLTFELTLTSKAG